MFKTLLKYNFITILEFKDTYYYTTTLPKKLKLSKDLINLNYLKYSPFKTPSILTLMQKKQLLLWFYPKAIDKAIVIPESYLAYRELKNRDEDAIYIIDDEIAKILVIKNSSFVGAYTLQSIDERVINLSMDEYELQNKIYISKDEYATLITNSQKTLKLQELYSFSQIDIDRKTLLKKFVDVATYPIVALVILAIFISYMQGVMLNSEIDELKQTYKEQKSKNKEIKQDIKLHNKEVKKYREFAKKELVFVGPIILLDSIYGVFKEGDKATLKGISISGTTMTLRIDTDENPIKYLNRLSEIKFFKQVIIQSTRKPKRGIKTITYDIEIRLLQDA